MDAIKFILVQFVVAMLCAGSLFGLLVGVGLLLRPERIENLNKYFSRWFSADKVTEQLDRQHITERFLYRHHRIVGGGLFIGALFILYVFLFGYDVQRMSVGFSPGYRIVVDVLTTTLIIGCIVSALVGIVVALRPSLLRDIEKSANRWVATDGIVLFFNKMSFSPDHKVLAWRKLSGALIVAGSLYVLIVLGPLLLRGGWNF